MIKKDIHYLEYLTDKDDKKTISETEKTLLDNFIKHEFDGAEWDTAQMGSKEVVSADMYIKIKKLNKLNKPFRNHYKYAVAASIILVLSLFILFKPKTGIESITLTTASVADSIQLSDGSLVYLAAHSTFKYPISFENGLRSVSLLKGNAFFKVAKDPAHPFIITSANIKTKVLGTSFHISLDKDKSSVTVITGHVSVYTNTQIAFLKPNESVVFTASGLKKYKVNDTSLYEWYRKDIMLTNVALHKVFALLNFKYGINFKPENNEMLNTRMTLYIKDGLPLQSILDQINYITHLKFRKNGETVSVNY